MPAVIPFIPLIAAGVTAGTGLAAARMQSNAGRDAAQLQIEAANNAAAIQAQSAREAERFQREAAQHAFRESETARRGNYDQWAARERRLGSIGELLGFGTRGIPDYVPGVDPQFVGSGQTAAAAAHGSPMGSIDDYLRGVQRQRSAPRSRAMNPAVLYPMLAGGALATIGAFGGFRSAPAPVNPRFDVPGNSAAGIASIAGLGLPPAGSINSYL